MGMGGGFIDYNRAQEQLTNKEIELRFKGKKEPDRPPGRKPGDNYIILGFVIGLIAGGALGSFFNFLVFGAIGGGILGAYIPSLVKKYRRHRESRKSGDDGSGIFK